MECWLEFLTNFCSTIAINPVVMNNIVTGTAAESSAGQLLASGLATNRLTVDLTAKMGGLSYGSNVSMPQSFSGNVFWDNRVSNGMVVGNGSFSSPTELDGLGMYHADVWHYDIGSATGVPLEPVSSTIQNFGIFSGSCDNIPSLFLPPFIYDPPFKCDSTLRSMDPNVKEEVKWGADTLTVQVQGLAVTLAGTNTFQKIADPSLFEGGPIGDYTLGGAMRGPPRLHGFSIDDNGRSGSRNAFLWLLMATPIAAFVYYVSIKKKAKATRNGSSKPDVVYLSEDVPSDDDGDRVALIGPAKQNRASGRFVAFLMVVFGFSKEVTAHSDCTVDCLEQFTPIVPQAKYKTALFIPPVIDKRSSSSCNTTIDLYMKQSYQDFGVKDANGFTLMTPIYGYALSSNDDATYPGPTIVTHKDCPIKVKFHNNLGIGPHMFPIDRSINCGNAHLSADLCAAKHYYNGTSWVDLFDAPIGADEDFYCNCTSQHGSERRTTTQ